MDGTGYPDSAIVSLSILRYGVVANIIASHAIARGSIPRVGNLLSVSPWAYHDGSTLHHA